MSSFMPPFERFIYFLRFCREDNSYDGESEKRALVSRFDLFNRFVQRRYSEMIKHFYVDTSKLDTTNLWHSDPICGPFMPMFLKPGKSALMRRAMENLIEYICAGEQNYMLENIFIDYNTPEGPNQTQQLLEIFLVRIKPSADPDEETGVSEEERKKLENKPYYILKKPFSELSTRNKNFEILHSSYVSYYPSALTSQQTMVPRIGAVLFDADKAKNFTSAVSESPFLIFYFYNTQYKNEETRELNKNFEDFESKLKERKTQFFYLNSEIDFFCGLHQEHRNLELIYAHERVFKIAAAILNYRGKRR